MKSIVFLIAALLILPAFVLSQTAERDKHIGYEYVGVNPGKLLPNGFKHLGGGLIGDYNADPVYGISQLEKGKTKMLWLEVSTGQNSTGVTGWLVKDALVFPRFPATDYLFLIGDPAIICQRFGKEIPNLVGVGKIVRQAGVFKPSKLWIADLKTENFKPESITGVKCVYSEP